MKHMDEQLKLFRALVLWIWNTHDKPWSYKGARAQGIYDEIQSGYVSINSPEQLGALLPKEENVVTDFSATRRFLYLNPIKESIVPVCSISCDFGRSQPIIRILCGLFIQHGGKVKGYGYRFEGPEGNGIHNYYHAQLIHGLGGMGNFPDCADWMSDVQPAFALDAKDVITFLISVLVSLYGLDGIKALRSEPSLSSQLAKYLEVMRWRGLGDTSWYWEVTFGCSKRQSKEGHKYFMTNMEEGVFKSRISKKFTGCHFQAITKGAYDAQPPGKRQTLP